ncbi:hypothetical protein H4219_002588 [Mycoemilia scoparia]|uniref:VWFA domain-containing protein n=1 Tax=Mycoemilia scoparia TaxID=417184 RepID=A0A9W8DUJ4_9FUNG|nr:hypothetical protein H4219_002588 [Mycoemilia scoparia]
MQRRKSQNNEPKGTDVQCAILTLPSTPYMRRADFTIWLLDLLYKPSTLQEIQGDNVSVIDLIPETKIPSYMSRKSNTASKVNSHSGSLESLPALAEMLDRKYIFTENTTYHILHDQYKVVFVLDASQSMYTLDSDTNKLLIDISLETLEKCLRGMAQSARIRSPPGPTYTEFKPSICISVMAYNPRWDLEPSLHSNRSKFHYCHTLLHCAWLNYPSIPDMMNMIRQRLREFEELIRRESEKISESLQCASQESSAEAGNSKDSETRSSDVPNTNQAEVLDIDSTEPALIHCLQLGDYTLRLLPENCASSLVFITDGVMRSNFSVGNVFESASRLVRHDTRFTIIQVGGGGGFNPSANFGYVVDNELLRYAAAALSGRMVYSSDFPENVAKNQVNFYHECFLIREFKYTKNQSINRYHYVHPGPMRISDTPREVAASSQEEHPWEGASSSNYGFPWDASSSPLKVETTSVNYDQYFLPIGLNLIIERRISEGFTLRSISIKSKGSSPLERIKITLELPWHQNVTIQYKITSFYSYSPTFTTDKTRKQSNAEDHSEMVDIFKGNDDREHGDKNSTEKQINEGEPIKNTVLLEPQVGSIMERSQCVENNIKINVSAYSVFAHMFMQQRPDIKGDYPIIKKVREIHKFLRQLRSRDSILESLYTNPFPRSFIKNRQGTDSSRSSPQQLSIFAAPSSKKTSVFSNAETRRQDWSEYQNQVFGVAKQLYPNESSPDTRVSGYRHVTTLLIRSSAFKHYMDRLSIEFMRNFVYSLIREFCEGFFDQENWVSWDSNNFTFFPTSFRLHRDTPAFTIVSWERVTDWTARITISLYNTNPYAREQVIKSFSNQINDFRSRSTNNPYSERLMVQAVRPLHLLPINTNKHTINPQNIFGIGDLDSVNTEFLEWVWEYKPKPNNIAAEIADPKNRTEALEALKRIATALYRNKLRNEFSLVYATRPNWGKNTDPFSTPGYLESDIETQLDINSVVSFYQEIYSQDNECLPVACYYSVIIDPENSCVRSRVWCEPNSPNLLHFIFQSERQSCASTITFFKILRPMWNIELKYTSSPNNVVTTINLYSPMSIINMARFMLRQLRTPLMTPSYPVVYRADSSESVEYDIPAPEPGTVISHPKSSHPLPDIAKKGVSFIAEKEEILRIKAATVSLATHLKKYLFCEYNPLLHSKMKPSFYAFEREPDYTELWLTTGDFSQVVFRSFLEEALFEYSDAVSIPLERFHKFQFSDKIMSDLKELEPNLRKAALPPNDLDTKPLLDKWYVRRLEKKNTFLYIGFPHLITEIGTKSEPNSELSNCGDEMSNVSEKEIDQSAPVDNVQNEEGAECSEVLKSPTELEQDAQKADLSANDFQSPDCEEIETMQIQAAGIEDRSTLSDDNSGRDCSLDIDLTGTTTTDGLFDDSQRQDPNKTFQNYVFVFECGFDSEDLRNQSVFEQPLTNRANHKMQLHLKSMAYPQNRYDGGAAYTGCISMTDCALPFSTEAHTELIKLEDIYAKSFARSVYFGLMMGRKPTTVDIRDALSPSRLKKNTVTKDITIFLQSQDTIYRSRWSSMQRKLRSEFEAVTSQFFSRVPMVHENGQYYYCYTKDFKSWRTPLKMEFCQTPLYVYFQCTVKNINTEDGIEDMVTFPLHELPLSLSELVTKAGFNTSDTDQKFESSSRIKVYLHMNYLHYFWTRDSQAKPTGQSTRISEIKGFGATSNSGQLACIPETQAPFEQDEALVTPDAISVTHQDLLQRFHKGIIRFFNRRSISTLFDFEPVTPYLLDEVWKMMTDSTDKDIVSNSKEFEEHSFSLQFSAIGPNTTAGIRSLINEVIKELNGTSCFFSSFTHVGDVLHVKELIPSDDAFSPLNFVKSKQQSQTMVSQDKNGSPSAPSPSPKDTPNNQKDPLWIILKPDFVNSKMLCAFYSPQRMKQSKRALTAKAIRALVMQARDTIITRHLLARFAETREFDFNITLHQLPDESQIHSATHNRFNQNLVPYSRFPGDPYDNTTSSVSYVDQDDQYRFHCSEIFSHKFCLHRRLNPQKALSVVVERTFGNNKVKNCPNMFVFKVDGCVFYITLTCDTGHPDSGSTVPMAPPNTAILPHKDTSMATPIQPVIPTIVHGAGSTDQSGIYSPHHPDPALANFKIQGSRIDQKPSINTIRSEMHLVKPGIMLTTTASAPSSPVLGGAAFTTSVEYPGLPAHKKEPSPQFMPTISARGSAESSPKTTYHSYSPALMKSTNSVSPHRHWNAVGGRHRNRPSVFSPHVESTPPPPSHPQPQPPAPTLTMASLSPQYAALSQSTHSLPFGSIITTEIANPPVYSTDAFSQGPLVSPKPVDASTMSMASSAFLTTTPHLNIRPHFGAVENPKPTQLTPYNVMVSHTSTMYGGQYHDTKGLDASPQSTAQDTSPRSYTKSHQSIPSIMLRVYCIDPISKETLSQLVDTINGQAIMHVILPHIATTLTRQIKLNEDDLQFLFPDRYSNPTRNKPWVISHPIPSFVSNVEKLLYHYRNSMLARFSQLKKSRHLIPALIKAGMALNDDQDITDFFPGCDEEIMPLDELTFYYTDHLNTQSGRKRLILDQGIASIVSCPINLDGKICRSMKLCSVSDKSTSKADDGSCKCTTPNKNFVGSVEDFISNIYGPNCLIDEDWSKFPRPCQWHLEECKKKCLIGLISVNIWPVGLVKKDKVMEIIQDRWSESLTKYLAQEVMSPMLAHLTISSLEERGFRLSRSFTDDTRHLAGSDKVLPCWAPKYINRNDIEFPWDQIGPCGSAVDGPSLKWLHLTSCRLSVAKGEHFKALEIPLRGDRNINCSNVSFDLEELLHSLSKEFTVTTHKIFEDADGKPPTKKQDLADDLISDIPGEVTECSSNSPKCTDHIVTGIIYYGKQQSGSADTPVPHGKEISSTSSVHNFSHNNKGQRASSTCGTAGSHTGPLTGLGLDPGPKPQGDICKTPQIPPMQASSSGQGIGEHSAYNALPVTASRITQLPNLQPQIGLSHEPHSSLQERGIQARRSSVDVTSMGEMSRVHSHVSTPNILTSSGGNSHSGSPAPDSVNAYGGSPIDTQVARPTVVPVRRPLIKNGPPSGLSYTPTIRAAQPSSRHFDGSPSPVIPSLSGDGQKARGSYTMGNTRLSIEPDLSSIKKRYSIPDASHSNTSTPPINFGDINNNEKTTLWAWVSIWLQKDRLNIVANNIPDFIWTVLTDSLLAKYSEKSSTRTPQN